MGTDLIRLMQALFVPVAELSQHAAWQPSADVHGTPYGWLVKFDLAGVQPEDIELTVRGSVLTVRGTRRDWCDEGCRHYLMEIAYSHFQRSVRLPAELTDARVDTECRHGLLLVRIYLEANE
ncbi:MAG: Hsp20/alpha crystallin family protein [Gemmataceae bacterium]|nr:Hsp20/alpha crystallin family protein [Gemmataceae bacterium]